jgi:hypothetical protein
MKLTATFWHICFGFRWLYHIIPFFQLERIRLKNKRNERALHILMKQIQVSQSLHIFDDCKYKRKAYIRCRWSDKCFIGHVVSTINIFSLLPTLIPPSGVGTTCFSSCCDKDSAIIFTTGRLPDVNPPWNWSGC